MLVQVQNLPVLVISLNQLEYFKVLNLYALSGNNGMHALLVTFILDNSWVRKVKLETFFGNYAINKFIRINRNYNTQIPNISYPS